MQGRRSFLRLLGGGAAAATTISPKDVAAALKEPSALGAGSIGNTLDPTGEVSLAAHAPVSRSLMQKLWRLREDTAFADPKGMPAHIATKQSWSPAFKEGVWRQEVAMIQELLDRLEADEQFAKKFAKAIGLST